MPGFSNSREECEAVTSTLREYCRRAGEPERFLIHHGNLSTPLRLDAEALMKEENALLTVCTTATLELGIDIGSSSGLFRSMHLYRIGIPAAHGSHRQTWVTA